ncbi:MAG: DUF2958 domain-containing protein, partial [Candidatus Pacebacteria bacterium]|nr:DUF2958 domain-containing protein [Candidatus Paceibacterota bacterium]
KEKGLLRARINATEKALKISDMKVDAKGTVQSFKDQGHLIKEEVELDEGGTYDNDRFLIKGNKAKLDNPKTGEKDGPNHVWAKNEKEALKKFKEEVELDEGKNSAVWTSPKTGKSYDIQKNGNRWEMDIIKKGSSIYGGVTTIKRKTPQELKDWLDGYKIDSQWMSHLVKESVNESTNWPREVELDEGKKKAKEGSAVSVTNGDLIALAETVLTQGQDLNEAKQKLMTSQIRKQLPKLYSQDGVADPMVYVKFFNPYGAGTWLITEFDGKDTMFGYVIGLGHDELGYTSLRELESLEGSIAGRKVKGLQGIERDTSFRPEPLSKAAKANGGRFTPRRSESIEEGRYEWSKAKKKAKKGSAVRVYTGDDVQLKRGNWSSLEGIGTVIACQHKRDGPQRCLLKMRKSGKEINTTVHPRQVIYSNVDNTVYSESVELDEALKPKDKNVIDAFYDKKKLEGKLLFTDGDKLEKLGMGRDTVAVWKGHKIVITSSSAVKSDDVILRYMKKSIPKLNFDPKSYKKYFGEESVRGNDMEDKFKLQKETVEFLKPTSKNLGESIPDFKSTDFKGSKSVTITRISGGSWGIMIQLTDKKRVPSNIQLPASEAVVLGRALQNKDLMKEE